MSMLMRSFGLDPDTLAKMGNLVAEAAFRMERIEKSLARIETHLGLCGGENDGSKSKPGGASGGSDGGSSSGNAIAAD